MKQDKFKQIWNKLDNQGLDLDPLSDAKAEIGRLKKELEVKNVELDKILNSKKMVQSSDEDSETNRD